MRVVSKDFDRLAVILSFRSRFHNDAVQEFFKPSDRHSELVEESRVLTSDRN